MIEINVNKEMWAEWRENHVTKLFFRTVFAKREQIKEELASGRYPGKETEAVMACMVLNDVLTTEFEEKEND